MKNSFLTNKVDVLRKNNIVMKKENHELKKYETDLKKIIEKFANEKKILKNVLIIKYVFFTRHV